MSVVEFTPRAVRNLLNILGKSKSSVENKFLLVECQGEEAEVSFPKVDEIVAMQRDLDVIGPFRVPVGEVEMSLFVRDRQEGRGGRIELDALAVGGEGDFQRCNFQIRGRGGK
jgi:hypothetical protein